MQCGLCLNQHKHLLRQHPLKQVESEGFALSQPW